VATQALGISLVVQPSDWRSEARCLPMICLCWPSGVLFETLNSWPPRNESAPGESNSIGHSSRHPVFSGGEHWPLSAVVSWRRAGPVDKLSWFSSLLCYRRRHGSVIKVISYAMDDRGSVSGEAELSTTPISAVESHTTIFTWETVAKELKDEAENSSALSVKESIVP
jgi:hypothetical protein